MEISASVHYRLVDLRFYPRLHAKHTKDNICEYYLLSDLTILSRLHNTQPCLDTVINFELPEGEPAAFQLLPNPKLITMAQHAYCFPHKIKLNTVRVQSDKEMRCL